MRVIPIFLFFLLACGHNNSKNNETNIDSTKSSLDSSLNKPNKDSASTSLAPDAAELNLLLKAKFNKWHVLIDAEAKWDKDEFDYFIPPERKKDPNYPYIAIGDYNYDGNPDKAALVTDSAVSQFRIAIFINPDKIILWEEDIILGAAISTMPKADLLGYEGVMVKLKGEAIDVVYFEKSSFILFWDGSKFKQLWTSD